MRFDRHGFWPSTCRTATKGQRHNKSRGEQEVRITLKAGVAAAALAATALLAPQPGWAQKTLTIGGYGGSFETLMKEHIIPPFEKEHNVTIQFVPGNSTENLARLQAQKDNQEMDVVILDDGPMRSEE